MDKTGRTYSAIDQLFEHPVVFNAYQALADGGKGRAIRRFLADRKYGSVVDIGCGTGNWARLFDADYMGVDNSPSFIEGCRRRYAGDPRKEFVQADASTLGLDRHFDLAMMISVLHHLPDAEVAKLLNWLADVADQLFVLDLYPVRGNPVSRWLYRMDRGNYIREPEQQRDLLTAGGRFRVVEHGNYYCPNRLYRHTLFLLQSTGEMVERT